MVTSTNDTAVVFVHGLHGHPEKTWRQFQTLVDHETVSAMYPWWTSCDEFFYSYNSDDQIDPNTIKLSAFVSRVFPVPMWDLIGAGRTLPRRRYERLMLVGHSEGGVLVRSVVLHQVQKYNRLGREDLARALESDPILKANLRLFAPATWGALVSGWKGVLLRSPILGDSLEPLLSSSPGYQQLTAQSPMLQDIRMRTVECARRYPAITAFRAQNLFGTQDRLVCFGALATDPPAEYEQGCTHTSICKPTVSYLRPLAFVRHDEFNLPCSGRAAAV